MLAQACQTAERIWLQFFMGTHGFDFVLFHGQRHAVHFSQLKEGMFIILYFEFHQEYIWFCTSSFIRSTFLDNTPSFRRSTFLDYTPSFIRSTFLDFTSSFIRSTFLDYTSSFIRSTFLDYTASFIRSTFLDYTPSFIRNTFLKCNSSLL